MLLLLATGSVRTGRADTLITRLDRWLASPAATNLRASLAGEPAGTERHAFVVFDDHTEPEIESAEEQGTAFCPTEPPVLPTEVNVLWVLVGPVVWRYDPRAGWTARPAPPPAAAA